ncbi:uncharacterized protein LOC119113892 [Pollicipes pollicipes]|uniref:uncharacterized protein LOC119113892 n=1 Tax=Pollicipes pollicipes TaxID=41117 RepID=UPI0018856A95|nr:uncharacterized protein LOC119113892 [Pollicipes pollicipes]
MPPSCLALLCAVLLAVIAGGQGQHGRLGRLIFTPSRTDGFEPSRPRNFSPARRAKVLPLDIQPSAPGRGVHDFFTAETAPDSHGSIRTEGTKSRVDAYLRALRRRFGVIDPRGQRVVSGGRQGRARRLDSAHALGGVQLTTGKAPGAKKDEGEDSEREDRGILFFPGNVIHSFDLPPSPAGNVVLVSHPLAGVHTRLNGGGISTPIRSLLDTSGSGVTVTQAQVNGGAGQIKGGTGQAHGGAGQAKSGLSERLKPPPAGGPTGPAPVSVGPPPVSAEPPLFPGSRGSGGPHRRPQSPRHRPIIFPGATTSRPRPTAAPTKVGDTILAQGLLPPAFPPKPSVTTLGSLGGSSARPLRTPTRPLRTPARPLRTSSSRLPPRADRRPAATSGHLQGFGVRTEALFIPAGAGGTGASPVCRQEHNCREAAELERCRGDGDCAGLGLCCYSRCAGTSVCQRLDGGGLAARSLLP